MKNVKLIVILTESLELEYKLIDSKGYNRKFPKDKLHILSNILTGCTSCSGLGIFPQYTYSSNGYSWFERLYNLKHVDADVSDTVIVRKRIKLGNDLEYMLRTPYDLDKIAIGLINRAETVRAAFVQLEENLINKFTSNTETLIEQEEDKGVITVPFDINFYSSIESINLEL